MPGSVHSRTNTSALLKTIFDDDLQEAIQNETPFVKYAQRKDFPLDGSDFTIAVHLKRNARGNQATLISDDLPDSGLAVFKQGTIRAARVFQAFQIDNELIQLASRSAATFSERVEAIYDDAKSTMMKDGERQLLGDGSGVLHTILTVTGLGTATVTVNVDTTVVDDFKGVEDTRFMEEGMAVEIWGGATKRNDATDLAIVSEVVSDTQYKLQNESNPGVDVLDLTGTVATDVVIKRNNTNATLRATNTSKECNGLALIADDDTAFMGIDATGVTGFRRWRGTKQDAGAAPFSPGELGKAVIRARQTSSMKDHPNVAYLHPSQTWALVYGGGGTFPDQRYSREDVNKYGQPNKPVFNIDGKDVVLETCLDMQKSRCYLFNGDALLYGELQPPQLEDFGDTSILPAPGSVAGSVIAARRGWLSWRFNMGCRRRNAFILIHNLQVPAGF